jgi:hypothetical protein
MTVQLNTPPPAAGGAIRALGGLAWLGHGLAAFLFLGAAAQAWGGDAARALDTLFAGAGFGAGGVAMAWMRGVLQRLDAIAAVLERRT